MVNSVDVVRLWGIFVGVCIRIGRADQNSQTQQHCITSAGVCDYSNAISNGYDNYIDCSDVEQLRSVDHYVVDQLSVSFKNSPCYSQ